MKKYLLLVLVGIGMFAMLAMNGPIEDQKLKPSEAYDQFNAQFFEIAKTLKPGLEFVTKRSELAGDFADQCITEGINDDEWVKYADLLIIANRIDKALPVYKRVANGSGYAARMASKGLLSILSKNKEWNALEQGIAEHRKRFPPTPEDTEHLYSATYGLSYHFASTDNHSKAAELVLDELNSLPADAPYNSFMLPKYWAESFVEADKEDELLEVIDTLAPKLQTKVEEREANAPEEDKDYNRTTTIYKVHLNSLEAVKTKLTLVGNPAPNIELSHSFNGDISSLADLRGKVVIVDFWATWCKPCIEAFPHMRKLYEEHKDQGFVVLGVTSFQGRYFDGDVKEPKIGEARELELTRGFIEKHEMTWPTGFSKHSVSDPRYGVGAIPTFAVIDRKGVVRAIRTGSGLENEEFLSRFIPQLLAEE